MMDVQRKLFIVVAFLLYQLSTSSSPSSSSSSFPHRYRCCIWLREVFFFWLDVKLTPPLKMRLNAMAFDSIPYHLYRLFRLTYSKGPQGERGLPGDKGEKGDIGVQGM